MDEYLSEKEQIEQIRQWWRENGWYLIGGAVVAGLGWFGYGQYQEMQDRQAEAAGALYLELKQLIDDDRSGTDELLQQLADEHAGSPYLDQARLLIARDNLIADTNRAEAELATVMNESRDPGLAMVARLRLARVQAYREQYDAALATLDAEEPGEFAARIAEIRGDIYAARGNVEEARRAYAEALTGQGAESLDITFVQLKLADLQAAGADEEADNEAGESTEETEG